MPQSFDTSILHLLHRALQVAEGNFAREQGPAGITPRQFIVLSAISDNEGLSQTEIVERCGADRSTVADVIRRLISQGLVQKRRSRADARAFNVKLTSAGLGKLDSARVTARSTDELTLQLLTMGARRELASMLKAIISGPTSPAP